MNVNKLCKIIIGILLLIACFYGVTQLEEQVLEQSAPERLASSQGKHSDTYAWLKVEGTKIDYPVLQHPTDDSYYLVHDEAGNATEYGAIFMEQVNHPTFEDPVTIIYGHAMRDDSMFGSLDVLADEAAFETFQKVSVTLREKVYDYQIIAAYPFTDDHLYHTYSLGDADRVAIYVSQLETWAREYGGFYRPVVFDVERDKLLILSTCDVSGDGRRFVVHAVKKGES